MIEVGNGIPEQIQADDYKSIVVVCSRVCTKLDPSGSREVDEERIFETLCRIFVDRADGAVSFVPHPDSSRIDNLKEHLFLVINNQEQSDHVLEYVYEFLDNVYPQEDLWRLKMRNYDD